RERSDTLSTRVCFDEERDDAIAVASGTCRHPDPRRIAGRRESASARRHCDRRSGTSSCTDRLSVRVNGVGALLPAATLRDRRTLSSDDHATRSLIALDHGAARLDHGVVVNATTKFTAPLPLP